MVFYSSSSLTRKTRFELRSLPSIPGGNSRIFKLCVVHCGRNLNRRHLVQLFSVENEGDAAVSKDRRGGDTRNRAIALFDALDNNLLVSAQLVDAKAEPDVVARFRNDNNAAVVAFGRTYLQQIAKIDDRQKFPAQAEHSLRTYQIVNIGPRRPQAFDHGGHRNDV